MLIRSYPELGVIFFYIYLLVGTLLTGLRRWSFDQLGLNRQGVGLALGCGTAILIERFLIILSIEQVTAPMLTWTSLVVDLAFYFALVGLVKALLFRGFIHRLLLDWRGLRWAIWGSSIGFMLWHVFGQGLMVGQGCCCAPWATC